MSYHENPAINDTVLTVINDGQGEQCGYSYAQRLEAARADRAQDFEDMARNYSRYRTRYGSRNLTREEWSLAGKLLHAYYYAHIQECGEAAR